MEQILNLNTNVFAVEGAMTVEQMLMMLLVSIGLSIILFITYKLSYTRLNYNKKFNITLMMISFISTILMSLIQTNFILSVGMLGALTIVRFRTNIRDIRDIGFIFWALAIGITSASGHYLIGFIGSIIMALFMVVGSKESKNNNKMLLVIRGQDTELNIIQDILDQLEISIKVKAKNILSDSFELVYEVKTSKESDYDNIIIDRLMNIDGIDSVNVLAPNTEVL